MSNIEEEIGKGLAKIIPEVYQDLAKPTVVKLGKALGDVMGIVLGPAGKLGQIGEKNLIKLAARLDKNNDIVEVQPEISGPILERLRYTRSEELSNLYIELFAKAATGAGANSAHPSFFEVITNLSIDEARLIDYMKRDLSDGSLGIPYLTIKCVSEDGGFNIQSKYFAALEGTVDFINPKGEEFAFENLLRLGLLKEMEEKTRFKEGAPYEALEQNIRIVELKKRIEADDATFKAERRALTYTEFLRSFIETCVP